MTASDATDPDALFDLPPGTRVPVRRVVLLTGPSGTGKSSLVRRLGLPAVALDDFYHDADHPDMPRRYGIADWDSPLSWDSAGAIEALLNLCSTGRSDVPVYDIPTSRRTGTTHLDVTGSPLVVAEGIFAAELVERCRAEGILADALCITRPRVMTFWFRLLRDLGESRKPPVTLLRRGWGLLRDEPGAVRAWAAKGCRVVGPGQAEKEIRAMAEAATGAASTSSGATSTGSTSTGSTRVAPAP